ncbi:MBL fold metallo-hydrolase [Saccharibacillus sacchari]|uniref:MBL fold metallo-hydrolase n=1 Tax=Saccharibacillus sacchari TaxID=456493 RepID=A0ACC6PFM3_9BACL
MLQDHWFTVQRIDERTYAISEYGHWEKVHSFLLLGERKAALIDTGLGIDNIKRITDRLTDLPIDVLTTHVHTDHIGSHGRFERLYVHELDRDWLEKGIAGLTLEQIRRDIGRDITRPLPPGFDPRTYAPFRGKATGTLADGDVVELGGRSLTACHTPGHSPGHLSFFEAAAGYLFTGDLLYDETPVYAFYPSTSPVDLIASWEKIAALPNVVRVFGSHNTLGLAPDILGRAEAAAEYLRDRDLAKFGTGIHRFDGFSVQF